LFAVMPSGSLTSAKHDDPQHFSLSQVSVQTQITGPLASVTVHQRFSSGLEEPGDALYRFAIPASAELISFQLKAAKRVLVSQVREVQSTFSVTQAQQFHLLCPEADGTIQVRVENLPVGEEVVVEFQYLQWLNVEGAEYIFRYPNVSADEVEIRVNVEGGSTHVWSYKGWAEGPFEVRLPAEPGLFLTQEHFMVALPPSALPTTEAPRDLVFVLDRTVSMDGARKRSARGAISRVLRGLGERERFALWGLDRQWEWFRQGKFNGADQVAAAETWLDAMPTAGGIAVPAVLERLMALKEESGRRLWAVIISDGPVEFDESIISQLQEKAPQCRLSFLQIDGPTGDPLLPYVTRLGGGSYHRVAAAGGADEAAAWMDRESRSALQHLQPVDRGLNFLPDSLVPDRLNSPNGNETVLLFGRKLGVGGLELRWDEGKLALEPKVSTNRGVGISWARERINVLQGRLRARPSMRSEAQKEISRLALQYGLTTSHTALVLQPEGVKDKSVAWAPPGWDGNQNAPEAPLSEQLRSLSEETPIVRVANLIISQAIVGGASHVHLQSHNGSCSVLYRVDGVLHPVMQPPNYLMPALLARLRIMAGLQPEPARTTRCGLIELDFEGRAARLEVLTCPSDRGEKMVLTVRRLPDSEQLPRLDLLSEGWKEGLVLVVGPVRSGVTTTLRRLLRNATHWGKNVVSTTNEGNNIRGVDHVSLEDTALPHGLDCDGWLVGTLRSPSLALAAVEAAAEGRLVIAGINASSKAQAVRRLVQMGVDEELLQSTLVGVVEQRMIRRLCSDCSPGCGVMGTGCERCGNTGYRGRLALVGPTLADLRTQATRYHEQGVVDRAEVDRVLPPQ
jgi:general secretion pathway protein E